MKLKTLLILTFGIFANAVQGMNNFEFIRRATFEKDWIGATEKSFLQWKLKALQETKVVLAEHRDTLNTSGIIPKPGIITKLIMGGMALGPLAHSLIKINQLAVRRQELQRVSGISQKQKGQQILINKHFDQREVHPKYSPAHHIKLFTTGSSTFEGIKEQENIRKIHASFDRLSASADENDIINSGYSVSKLCANLFVNYTLPYFGLKAANNYLQRELLRSALNSTEENIQVYERTIQQQLQQLNGK